MTTIPSNFSKWPGFVQRIWMKAHPGVTVRDHGDHGDHTHVHIHRGHHHHPHRPGMFGGGHHYHGCDGVEPYRPDPGYGSGRRPGYRPDPGFTNPGYRPIGGRPLSDSQFDRMLASGDIEGLLNSPGAGEWLKKPENNLKVMMAIQNENRLFSLLSNVLKTKHDTDKAIINNVRA